MDEWQVPLPYDEFLEARKLSTARAYRAALKWFDRFLDGEPLTPTALLRFPNWLSRQKDLSGNSKALYLVAVRVFVHWMEYEERIEIGLRVWSQFSDLVRSLACAPPPIPRAIAPQDIARMIAYESGRPVKDERGRLIRLRNVAILETLRATGCRAGELVSMTRGDLDYVKGETRVIGKRGKARLVFFDDRAWEALDGYLRARGDGGEARSLSSYPVFARHGSYTKSGARPLTAGYVWKIVSKCAERAGVDRNAFPHAFRHAFAHHVMEAQADLAVVQEMLGHSSPETTRVYYNPNVERLREAHRRAFGGSDG